jgi:hypothetical protein
MYSERFENLLAFKVNNLKELCGRLPDTGDIFLLKQQRALLHLLLSYMY